jgi:uncharacterized membrane protein YdbT with pleckstrin-like domain
MGYIDENLMNDEHVVYRSKLHWIIFLVPIIFAILGFLFILAFLAFLFEGAGKGAMEILWFVFFSFLIAIILAILTSICRKTSEFGITNKRVLMKMGFIMRDSLEIFLTKVEGIQVRQGILGRIFNYGTIVVKGTGGTRNIFCVIEDPMEFRKKVQEQIASIQ